MMKKLIKYLILSEITFAQRISNVSDTVLSDDSLVPTSPHEYTINIQLPVEWGVNEIIQHEIKTSTFTSMSLLVK